MSTPHVHRIIDSLGSSVIEERLGLTGFSVRAAKRDGMFPARWYRPMKALCVENNVECPDEAFRWIDADKKTVPKQGSFHGSVKDAAQ